MSAPADLILSDLRKVGAERAARSSDPSLGRKVALLKHWQQQRFAGTHADLLAHPRYQAAARFFLDELYGPHDFSARDEGFARIVPALVRLFPKEVVATVVDLAALHALSESLDSAMARHLPDGPVGWATYQRCWQSAVPASDRHHQLALVLQVGRALDRFTRHRLLRVSLKMMHGPAQAAGLGALQNFLEAGFDAFAAMQGADGFLAVVARRERALMDALYGPELLKGPTPA